MKTGVTTVTAHVHTDPTPVLGEWRELSDRVGTVFSSRPGFVLRVADATQLDCEYVAIRRGGRVVAFAAVSVVRRGPLRLAKVVGTDLGVPLEFLSEDDEASDALLDALAAQGYMLSADSLIMNDTTVLRLMLHGSWTVDAPIRERVPVIDLPPGASASALRSAKSLKRLRQYRSEAARTSSFRVETITDVAHLDSRWGDIVAVAEAAIRGTDKVNYLVSPHGEFARDFLRDEARAGRLCIAGIVIGGEWVAHEIGVRTKDRMEGWLTHYAPGFGTVQPGHQLIEWFADAHDELGVTELDQGVGVNRIKTTWANSGYDVLRVSAVPAEWLLSGVLVQALRRYSPTLAWIRQIPLRVGERLVGDRTSTRR